MIKPPLDYVMGMQKELNLFYGDMVYWDGSTETLFSENPSQPFICKVANTTFSVLLSLSISRLGYW